MELNYKDAAVIIIRRTNKKKPQTKNIFNDRRLAKRTAIKQTKIEDLLKILLHEHRP